MKKVLFLAPNYKYIRTTVTGITRDLIRHKVQFVTNVPYYSNEQEYKEGEELYLHTSGVEVIFNHDDPISWTSKMLHEVDTVYGKKELVDLIPEKFPFHTVRRPKGRSLQRYISENNKDTTDPTVCDDFPPKTQYIPEIKNVYFNEPMTVVMWADGTKTMVKCQDGDLYSEETGLAVAIAKKALGNKGNFNNVFKKWLPEHKEVEAQSLLSYMFSNIRDFWNSEENKEEKNHD